MLVSSHSALPAIYIDHPVARINTVFVPNGQAKNILKEKKSINLFGKGKNVWHVSELDDFHWRI